MKIMRYSYFFGHLLGTLLLTFGAATLAHAESLDIQAFEENLYPFMRKNCSECHSETAIYPVGPSHSHSDKKIAFSTFQKYLNPSDLKSSKFIKTGSNKHFCNEHSYNCDKADQVVEELKTRFLKFSEKSSTSPNGPDISEGTEITDASPQFVLMALPGTGETLALAITLEKYKGNDHRKITDVSIRGSKGTFFIEGLDVKKNGQKLNQKHGLELLNRFVLFNGFSTLSQKLNSSNPVINVKTGDRLSIGALGFKPATYHDDRCEKMDVFNQFLVGKNENLGRLLKQWTGNENIQTKEACLQLTSRLGEGTGSSVLWSEIEKSLRPTIFKQLSDWNKATQGKLISLPKTIKIAAGRAVTCFQSETKDWYCRGRNDKNAIDKSYNSFSNFTKIVGPEEIVDIQASLRGLALKGKSGRVYISNSKTDEYSIVFERLIANKQSPSGDKVSDIHIGRSEHFAISKAGRVFKIAIDRNYRAKVVNVPISEPVISISDNTKLATFYLTKSGRVYASPSRNYGYQVPNSAQKISTGKEIKKIGTSDSILCALTVDGELLCSRVSSNSFSSASQEAVDQIEMVPLARLNKKVLDFSMGSTMICIKDFDHKVECQTIEMDYFDDIRLNHLNSIRFQDPYPRRKVVDFSMGHTNNCFLFDDGVSTCVGDSASGSIGSRGDKRERFYQGEGKSDAYPFLHIDMLKE